MTDLADLAARLAAGDVGDELGLWRELNITAKLEGWITEKQAEQNIAIIISAVSRIDPNILIAVAMSIVPPGWRWSMRQDPNWYTAIVHRSIDQFQRVFGQTPALALAAAAVKARAALKSQETQE